ncbi:NAD(P)-dependent oxidoreductase [soil metagenome]
MTATFAIVAPGAMGAAIGARLVSRGARVVTSLQGRGDASRRRAQAAGLIDVSERDLMNADLYLSIVPPANAAEAAHRFAELAVESSRQPPFIDLNAISPQRAHAVANVVRASGARFIDGGIIGLPPTPDSAGPTLYLSGPVGDAGERLRAHGVAVKELAGDIGAASALKMSYAGITKGMTALGTAMILAADRHGASEALHAELRASAAHVIQRLEKSIPDMLPKAWRWAPEMHEIADYLGDDFAEAGAFRAIAELYERIADDAADQKVESSALLAFVQRAAGS